MLANCVIVLFKELIVLVSVYKPILIEVRIMRCKRLFLDEIKQQSYWRKRWLRGECTMHSCKLYLLVNFQRKPFNFCMCHQFCLAVQMLCTTARYV